MKSDSSGNISRELIVAEVARFWTVFTSKEPKRLEEFYDPQAVVFASAAKKSEPGRLTVVRRKREYFSAEARLHHSLGAIDVQVIGAEAAIASYVFRFEAKNMAGNLGMLKEERISQGRATQVFMLGCDGILRIVHEHFSIAMPGEPG